MLILVRHGQTEVNAGGRLQGRVDPELTETGRLQAAAIAKALRPHRVVSSPLRRAVETARLLGGDVEIDERWVELDYGEMDGRLLRDIPASFWERWRREPDFAPPGGESLVGLGERVRAACADLEAEAAERDVVVVSHVSPIKAAVAWALGASDSIVWRMFLDVGSISRVGFGPRGPFLLSYNLSPIDSVGGLPRPDTR